MWLLAPQQEILLTAQRRDREVPSETQFRPSEQEHSQQACGTGGKTACLSFVQSILEALSLPSIVEHSPTFKEDKVNCQKKHRSSGYPRLSRKLTRSACSKVLPQW